MRLGVRIVASTKELACISAVRWPARSSCSPSCCSLRPRAQAQWFIRRALPDPAAQEVTAEFLMTEAGGVEPRKGTAWKVHYARGLHKGLYITGAWFKRRPG